MSRETILERIRKICLHFPEAVEAVTFGHPTFRAGKKTFAVVEEYKGHYSLAMSVGKFDQPLFLRDARFYLTPYIGHRGWVSLDLEQARLNWKEIGALLRTSYTQVATKKMLDVLAGRELGVKGAVLSR